LHLPSAVFAELKQARPPAYRKPSEATYRLRGTRCAANPSRRIYRRDCPDRHVRAALPEPDVRVLFQHLAQRVEGLGRLFPEK